MQPTRSESARQPRGADAGFSLVEVLAALVVTMLLVLALAPFAGQMLATWSRGSTAARLVELKSRGLGVIKDDLRHAVVWTGFGQTENLVSFRGTETALSFPVATGLTPGRDGLELISLTIDASVDGAALVRRRASIVGSTHAGFRDPVVLFSGRFKYFFRYFPRSGTPIPVWANRMDLPDRVELNISDERGRIFSAPIEIPLFASFSAGCLVNSSLPGCPNVKQEDENEWMKAYGIEPPS